MDPANFAEISAGNDVEFEEEEGDTLIGRWSNSSTVVYNRVPKTGRKNRRTPTGIVLL